MNMNPIPEQEYTSQELISASMRIRTFTVKPGVAYIAPDGKTLTMVVDGVETAMRPGTYKGDIRLCVREGIAPPFMAGYFTKEPVTLRAALCVDSDGVHWAQSVDEALQGAQVDNAGISGGKLISMGKTFGGIVIKDRDYRISKVSMNMVGRGEDDFIGIGAGILIGGNSKVLIEDCFISTAGCIRPALTVGGTAKVLMKDCEVMAFGAGPTEETQPPAMNNVPWPLALKGNCRATNLVKGAHVCYENCRMRSYGWGVLSTDDSTDINLYAKDCLIEITGPSGYGSYSVGNSKNTFDHCIFQVPDYALIVADAPASGIFKNGTVIRSGKNAIMFHSNLGSDTYVEAGCDIETKEALFLIKSCHPRIHVNESNLFSKDGVLLQMMDSDDAGLFGTEFEVPDGSSVRQETVRHENDMYADFSNMSLQGDFYNGMTGKPLVRERGQKPISTAANLVLTLDHVTLTGTISSSHVRYRNLKAGEFLTPENNREIGSVLNTAIPAINNGVIVELRDTIWTVTGISYLSALTINTNSQVYGHIEIDGKTVHPVPGQTYTGNITVYPAE